MGLGRLIFGYILKLRDVFQRAGARLFTKLRNPETGKFKYLSPNSAKKILYIFAGAFFAIVIISQLATRDRFLNHSFDDYQKEIRSDGGTRMRSTGNRALFDKDPLAGQLKDSGSVDPMSDIVSGTSGDYAGKGSSSDDMFGRVASTTASNNGPLPSASECFDVIERAKTGAALGLSDRSKLNSCITNNVVPISESEKNILRALAAGDLSPAERSAILSTLKGTGDEKNQGLSDVIMASVDPSKQSVIKDGVNKEFAGQGVDLQNDDVRGLSKELATKPKNYEQAIDGTNKILLGNAPDGGEKANLVDAIRALKGGETAALDNPNLTSDKERALQDLIQDLNSRDSKLQELKQQLAEAQADARQAAEKLTSGASLSGEEQAALDKLSALRKQVDALAAIQEKRQRTLIELTARLQKSVAQAELSIQKSIPSGVFEGYADYQPLDCKNLKPIVKISKHSNPKGSSSGLKIKSKQAYNVYKIEDEIGKSASQPDGKRLDISKYMQADIPIGDSFIMKGSTDRGISLGAENKIAAMLDSEIMVSSNGGGQVVRIKVMQDVFDSKDRRLVIPKNSIAIGKASSFDENTGVMDFLIDKVSVGSGVNQVVQLRIGSGDGTMGLKGQVRDTRGRYLLGAFITAFTAGALDFFTQSTITQYQQSAVAATALTGSAYSGGADVMAKIAGMYSSDLQNAPKIFYAPRGLPIVLYPE
jgi:hypothetical protein